MKDRHVMEAPSPGSDESVEPLITDLLQDAAALLLKARRQTQNSGVARSPLVEQHSGSAFSALATYWLRRTSRDVVYLSGQTNRDCDSSESERCRQELAVLAGRGGSIRMLYHPKALRTANQVRFAEQMVERGASVRISEANEHSAAVFDGQCALVRRTAIGRSPRCLLIRSPDLIQPLMGLTDSAWNSAMGLSDFQRYHDGEMKVELVADVVTLLSEGHKDEVAARILGVSVRTYRRHVAEVMRRLGARSRFQAGARASMLGLVTEPRQPE